MASISDVAQRAGVSLTTVSHTLSGKRPVSAEMRSRVAQAMRELGYSPSRTAQNLARGRTQLLALVVPDIANGFFAELAKGVERSAVERGYNVILCTTGFDHAREVQYLEMIRSRAVDGIVYAAGAPPTDGELSDLLRGMPLIFVDEEIENTKFPSVVSDNAAGGAMAAAHLAELGHRSSLVLQVEEKLMTSVRRVQGFAGQWIAAGNQPPALAYGDFSEEGGRRAVMPYLDAIKRGELTAIFAGNDLMALGAMDVLRSEGITLPRDVSIVGFDDSPAARYSVPELTTVRQDVLGLGTTVTDLIIAALSGDSDAPHQSVLPVELVVRGSTARPLH